MRRAVRFEPDLVQRAIEISDATELPDVVESEEPLSPVSAEKRRLRKKFPWLAQLERLAERRP